MRVLVACEFSGIVRDAFTARGHDAYSVDLLDSERPGQHIRADVRQYLGWSFDMMIAFPPCVHLCISGASRRDFTQMSEALWFVRQLMATPIPRIAIENPPGAINTYIRKPDQIVQPWMFGDGETKATCLWLKNLPTLCPTQIVPGREHRIANMPQRKSRAQDRSRTYRGIADAMADQWGGIPLLPIVESPAMPTPEPINLRAIEEGQ